MRLLSLRYPVQTEALMREHGVGRDQIVEERQWRHGVEMISHVNHSHVARVRTALGIAVGWIRSLGEMRAARAKILPLRTAKRRRLNGFTPRRSESIPEAPSAVLPPSGGVELVTGAAFSEVRLRRSGAWQRR